jgi:hypothetical protein
VGAREFSRGLFNLGDRFIYGTNESPCLFEFDVTNALGHTHDCDFSRFIDGDGDTS